MLFGLFTDLYELTMADAYMAAGLADEPATFDLFVRRLPERREVLVACGIATALDRLASFRFDRQDLAYLRSLGLFDEALLDRLAAWDPHLEIRAVEEGELVYAAEPLVSVTGPLLEAQVLETLLINTVGLETMIASKAARVAAAAAGRTFVDFSARRDHGVDAALAAARASYVGGAAATSLVLAGRRLGIPVTGTMAHSYVMAHADEVAAFVQFLGRYGERSVLLVDTYGVETGARAAVAAMTTAGITARAVRIDSGDLGAGALAARRILDDAGFGAVRILVSGDLDEDRIAELVGAGAPIDSFGVGTRLGTSSDAPYLGMVYKLVECAGVPRRKLSEGKPTLPGVKQVYRMPGRDVIALAGEPEPPTSRPLLQPIWRRGVRLRPPELLAAVRDRCSSALAHWSGPSEVLLSGGLAALVGDRRDLRVVE
ncbi:MAG TPA: nicotinate phosphoribosyltransferase [Acidimicrobiales bacterium]